MTRISVGEARRNLADTVNRVAFADDRVILHRNGKDVVALVSLEDLRILESLEDRADIAAALAAERAAAERGEAPIPWDRVKADLGL